MEEPSIRGNKSPDAGPQRERLVAFLEEHGMARLAEIRKVGITAATVSRLERAGIITRLGRGLYQLTDAIVESNHSLAEATKPEKATRKNNKTLQSQVCFFPLSSFEFG